jgi:hypothetical protein
MPRIIHRVFVSSTYEDLREERAEVQKALLMLDFFPVGMELFPSADDETWEFIKRQIAESDYYIVIVAGKYGSPSTDGTSFTEKEYDYAREIGKPVIAFLHKDLGNLPARLCESDPKRQAKLESFRQKIRPYPVRFFENADELAKEVLASIVKLRDSHPRPGFVRADESADLKKYTELLEENSRLKADLAKSRSPSLFEGADQTFSLSAVFKTEGSSDVAISSHEVTRGEAFLIVADELLSGSVDDAALENAFIVGLALERSHVHPEVHGVKEILRALFAFGLITFELTHNERSHPVWTQDEVRLDKTSVPVRHWKLTEFGQAQYGVFTARHGTPRQL